MEKRDLYNKNKNLTGKTIYKGEKIPHGYYILVVLTMIRNSKGEYLIQKRSRQKGRKIWRDWWTCKNWRNRIRSSYY